ncbi:DMT family transporter [Leucobacter sp. 7(1)]|uniref:DMT family transporter n=1 Tax=Leucobacter sp. 7(1) TaxID=1255613 RepID=UPI000B34E761|nr:DMT family transporter [Leucobacter sp. 7(1)]
MSRTRSFPVWAALLGSGLAGVLVALQSRINGGLSQQIGNGYVTAAVSFAIGLVVMTVVLLASRKGRAGLGRVRTEVRTRRLPAWTLIGGAGGAFFVLSQGLVAPLTGLALFTVGIVAGQVLGGLVLDRIGLGPGGRIDPTPTRIAGTVLAVIAVIVSVGFSGDATDQSVLWLVVFPVFVGVLVSAQSMVNGLVRSAAQSAITATFVNFVVGTTLLGLIAVISVATSGWPTEWPSSPVYYLGGVIGTIFIAVAAMLVRTAGVLLLSMSNVAGQLLAALAFDAGAPLGGGLTLGLVAGTAVALLAVVIAALPWRPRSAR